MNKLKYKILFVILVMLVGMAAVTSNLVINGNTSIASNPDDFLVYFSDAKIDGIQDLSLVDKETSLVFNKELSAVGQSIVITYDVTNASKNYDADIDITCTQSTEYLTITNSFDISSNLAARSTRTGTLSIKLSKSYTGEEELIVDTTCTINASAVERTSQGSGTVSTPVNPYYIGREISIGTEKFNIIRDNGVDVTLLAQYNLGVDYKQSTTINKIAFSNSAGWDYTPGPDEIDIQFYDGATKSYLNDYVSYLKEVTGDLSISGRLITLAELKLLGCTINNDYSYSAGLTCANSKYKTWLVNNQSWWTSSASSSVSDRVWLVQTDGNLELDNNYYTNGIRPTITINKEVVEQLINVYNVGKEISIGDEKFNVISDNGTTVSMLTQYNIGTDYRQSTKSNHIKFSSINGWEYEPGPKEIDIQEWSPNIKTYINAYVEYLKEEVADNSVTGDLITLKELQKLGCKINDDYSRSPDITCVNAPYASWLVNNQLWWTRSAFSKNANHISVVYTSGVLDFTSYGAVAVVRPVITISKDILGNLG